jgi:hypothetical protein
MKDVTTTKPLYVSTDGTAGPYIMVPVAQLDEVCHLLERHRVRYSVDEDVISLDGEPEVAIVNLGRGGDAEGVQKVLDGTD